MKISAVEKLVKIWELKKDKRYILFLPAKSCVEQDAKSLGELLANLGYEGVVARIDEPEKIRVIEQKKR